jgi:hypothetical protein
MHLTPQSISKWLFKTVLWANGSVKVGTFGQNIPEFSGINVPEHIFLL